MRKPDLLQFTEKGIYCAAADVYIDPWRKVDRALITHAHSDHARSGSLNYLAHHDSAIPLKVRLGKHLPLQTVAYGEVVHINGVNFSFHPAGHVIGSSQIRVEYQGEVWVFTGDYKLEDDGFSSPFESVKCHTFITESTFGLPIYQWQTNQEIQSEINAWWKSNAAQGKCSIMLTYSLGKAQRLLKMLDQGIGPVYEHAVISTMHSALRDGGHDLPGSKVFSEHDLPKDLNRSFVLIPPNVSGASWMKKLEPFSLGIASGWMAVKSGRNRMTADRGFVLSDHADWPGLNKAVEASGAERILVTHGFSETYAHWLREQGYQASSAETFHQSASEI